MSVRGAEWVKVERTGETPYFWNRADNEVLWTLPAGAHFRYHQKFRDALNTDVYFVCASTGNQMPSLPSLVLGVVNNENSTRTQANSTCGDLKEKRVTNSIDDDRQGTRVAISISGDGKGTRVANTSSSEKNVVASRMEDVQPVSAITSERKQGQPVSVVSNERRETAPVIKSSAMDWLNAQPEAVECVTLVGNHDRSRDPKGMSRQKIQGAAGFSSFSKQEQIGQEEPYDGFSASSEQMRIEREERHEFHEPKSCSNKLAAVAKYTSNLSGASEVNLTAVKEASPPRTSAMRSGDDFGPLPHHEVFRNRVHQLLKKEKLGLSMGDLAWKWQEAWPSDPFDEFKPCKKVKDSIAKYVDGVTIWNMIIIYIDTLPLEDSPLTDPICLKEALEQARVIKDMAKRERIETREVFMKAPWEEWDTVYQMISVGPDTTIFRCVLSVVLPNYTNAGCATSSPLVGTWAYFTPNTPDRIRHEFTVALEEDVFVYRESQGGFSISGVLHRVDLDDWWEANTCDHSCQPFGRIRLRLATKGYLEFQVLQEGQMQWESDTAYPSKTFYGFGEGPIMSMTAAAVDALKYAPPGVVKVERQESKSDSHGASSPTKVPRFRVVKPFIDLVLTTSIAIRKRAQELGHSAPGDALEALVSIDVERLRECIEELIDAVCGLLVGSETSGEAVPVTDPNWSSSKFLLLAWQYALALRDTSVVERLISAVRENLEDMIQAEAQRQEVSNDSGESQWWITGSPDGLEHERLEINRAREAKSVLQAIGLPISMFEEMLELCAWSLIGKSPYGALGDEVVAKAILQLQPAVVPPAVRYASHFMQLLYLERCEELKTSFADADSEANSHCLGADLPVWNGVWSHTGMHRSDLELVLPPHSLPFRSNGPLRRGDTVMVFPYPPVQGGGFIASVRADFDKDSDIQDGAAQKMKLKLWAVTMPEPALLRAYGCVHFFVQMMSSSSTVTHTRQVEAVKQIVRENSTGYNSNVRKLITESWKTGNGVGDIETACDGTSAGALAATKPEDMNCFVDEMCVPLTPAQSIAVDFALSRTCTMIRGPPGTGKTHTACAIVRGWLSAKDARILVVTQSNVAALNIYERLEQFDIPSVRIGLGMAPHELLGQRYFASLFDDEELKPLRAAVEDSPIRGRRGHNSETPDAVPFWAITSLLQKATRKSNVVVMTCISSGNASLLNQSVFNRVLIDEAAQAPEPTSLVPLMTGAAAFVGVGDDRQLPATVMSYEAKIRGFNESLFSRLLRQRVVNEGDGFVQLDIQRRMHSTISRFPSEMFYDGAIQNGCKDADRPIIHGFPWPGDFRVCFVQCGFHGEQSSGTSVQNQVEAEIVSKVLSNILRPSRATGQDSGLSAVKARDIAVITGYSAQRELLKQYIRREIEDDNMVRKIRIDTVDGFQGMERDLVLVSTARSNNRGDVGFLRDRRRANVLLTRARRGLIIFGDGRTLTEEREVWRPWLQFVEHNGGIIEGQTLDPLKVQ